MPTTAGKLAKARAAVEKDEAKAKLGALKAKLAEAKAKVAAMPAGKAKAVAKVKMLELQQEVEAVAKVARPARKKKATSWF